MNIMWILSLVLTGLAYYTTNCVEIGSTYLTACAGREFNAALAECPSSAVMKMRSLTLYASTDTESIGSAGDSLANCINVSQCKRIIHNSEDSGLAQTYSHLYSWFQNLCEGKQQCEGGTLPPWWALTGEIRDDASSTKSCPVEGTKYFTGVFIHFDCLIGETVLTVAPPPETTPATRPTTPATTTMFPVFVPIYLPVMQPIEKIILGVVIGLAIAILIVLLIILYCCERYQKNRKFKRLLRMLGAPKAQDDYDDFEDYTKAEAWADGDINMDAIGEYTGVKPDEFLSMTHQNLMNTGQIMPDSMYNTMTTNGRRNSCSTLNSRLSGVQRYPSGVTNGAYNGEMDYNTDENLDLERRMAAVLDSAGSDVHVHQPSDDDQSSSSGGPKSPNTIRTEQEYSPAISDDEENKSQVYTIDEEEEDDLKFDSIVSKEEDDSDSIMKAVLGSFSESKDEGNESGNQDSDSASTASLEVFNADSSKQPSGI